MSWRIYIGTSIDSRKRNPCSWKSSNGGRVLGEEDAATLRARFDLASLYARQGKRPEAEQLQRPTLAIQQRTLGPEHPNTLASLGNLAAFLNGQRRYQEAVHLLARAIDGRRRVLGADHPSTIVSLGNLAYSYEMLKDFARAEPIYLDTIELHRRMGAAATREPHAFGPISRRCT